MSPLPPSTRPPSPTELSYTQLAKRAPPFGSAASARRRGYNGVSSNDKVVQPSNNNPRTLPTPAVSTAPATAPRTAPPASISVPRFGNPGLDVHGGAPVGHGSYQTPQMQGAQHHVAMPLSAPMHFPPTAPLPQYQGMHMNYMGDPYNHRATPVEDRVSNLALKLQSMQQPGPSGPFAPNLHPQQPPRPNRMEEMHQFIDTLKNMQAAVSRTENEQQRVKKSRALHALLSMFENVVDELQTRAMDPAARDAIQELEEKVRRLEGENGRLNSLCEEREGGMRQMEGELQQCQRKMQQLAAENEHLKGGLDTAQRQCREEQARAQEAQTVAAESENVRDGLLANYARLTEENVAFQREMHEMSIEREKTAAEFEVRRSEISHLESQCEAMTEQLQHKDYNAMELEQKMGELSEQLAASQNLLQMANNDRQRLQDELHASQRNSTTASEQLLRMRDQFSQFRRGSDAKSQSQRTGQRLPEAANEVNCDGARAKATTAAQEEEQRRRVLAMAMSRAKGMGRALRANVGSKAEAAETNALPSNRQDPAGAVAEENAPDPVSSDGAEPAIEQLESSKVVAGVPAKDVAKQKSSPSTLSKNADEAGSPLEYSSSSVGPRSPRSGIDGYPLDEMDSIMDVQIGSNDNVSAASHAESLLGGPRKEDEQPNLLSYFYNQIKLAE